MAEAGFKVIQRIGVHHESSNINGISWSKDNRLALVTNSFVTIVNITGVQSGEKKKVSRLKVKRTAISVEGKPEDVDVEVDYMFQRLHPLSEAPYTSTALADPALSPTILKEYGYGDVTYAKWSPVGCDRTGRSVLAVLFRTNKLALYIADRRTLHGWCEVIDLSAKHYAEMKTGEYFKDKSSLKGELPADPRSKVGDDGTWKDFREWQRRKYLLNFTCIEWYPVVVSCLEKSSGNTRKFAFLATMVKSGQLFIWQAPLPLVKDHSFMYRAVAAYTSLFYPTCLAWHGAGDREASYLACGNADGIVKVFLMKITSNDAGHASIAIAKAYSFVDVPDEVSVECMAWYNKDKKLYLACSKGPHISLFNTQIMKEGVLSKPGRQIITGIHLLNVTGIAISPSGMLFSTSGEGTLQQFQIGSRVRSTSMDCAILAGHGYQGVSVSPNGVFLALYESRRQLSHDKTSTSQGEIAIIPLVQTEENVRELMASASKVVDMASIRDRLLFQEISKPDLYTTIPLPAVLRDFSQAYLQFLWNLFSSNPHLKKFTGGGDSVELGTDLPEEEAMSSEGSDEMQSIYRIQKIEKQVATLAMEKALNFFVQYHEGKTRTSNAPVLGDMTIKTICRWLAQRNPSSSVIDLLRIVWTICNPADVSTPGENIPGETSPEQSTAVSTPGENTPGETSLEQSSAEGVTGGASSSDPEGSDDTGRGIDIRQVILGSDVHESCICGQPITLKEARFGRCPVGHVWPRCCVTFKLLDGTNCRVCENCNAHALNKHPINSAYEDWTKHLLDMTSSCTYCGAWFEEV